jgi:hypothetical protein
MVFLVPTLENASEKTLKPKDFKISFGVLHHYELGQNGMGFGVAWLRTFGQSHVMPLLEVSWQDSSSVVGARLLLPLEAEVHWRPKPDLLASFDLRVVGGEYRTDGGEYITDNRVPVPNSWVRLWSLVAGPRLAISPKELVHFTVGGGWMFQRHIDKEDDDRKFLVSRTVGGAPYWQATVAFGEALRQVDIPERVGWR